MDELQKNKKNNLIVISLLFVVISLINYPWKYVYPSMKYTVV